MYRYIPKGICPKAIDVEIDGDKVGDVSFMGGCNGNLKAVGKLVKGMTIDEVASILEGNTCGNRPTSCADQLVKALRAAQAAEQSEDQPEAQPG